MEIPDGVTIHVEGLSIRAKGPKGEVEKTFRALGAAINADGKKVEVETRDKALRGTMEAHIRNMIRGVQDGYSKKLKIIYAHFPFTFEVKGDVLNIKNMLGEKAPRVSRIIGKTKV